MHLIAIVIGLVLLAGLETGQASLANICGSSETRPHLEYDIYRSGDKIGSHKVTFQKQGTITYVCIEEAITVRYFAGTLWEFEIYSYITKRSEVWERKRLVSYKSIADEHCPSGIACKLAGFKKPLSVNLERRGDFFFRSETRTDNIQPKRELKKITGTAIPRNYWNLTYIDRILNAYTSINPDTAEEESANASLVSKGESRFQSERKSGWCEYRVKELRERYVLYDSNRIWVEMKIPKFKSSMKLNTKKMSLPDWVREEWFKPYQGKACPIEREKKRKAEAAKPGTLFH